MAKDRTMSKARSTGSNSRTFEMSGTSGSKQYESVKDYIPNRPGGGVEDKKSNGAQATDQSNKISPYNRED